MIHLPAFVDHVEILADLKRLGWLDFKIETACNFANGYVAQLRCGNIREMKYSRAVRLYNFWLDERTRVPRGTTLENLTLSATT